MDPNVFITIAFASIVLLVALLFVAFVVPQVRREGARVERLERSRRPWGAPDPPFARAKMGPPTHWRGPRSPAASLASRKKEPADGRNRRPASYGRT